MERIISLVTILATVGAILAIGSVTERLLAEERAREKPEGLRELIRKGK